MLNVKPAQAQSIQEIWDTMKIPNLKKNRNRERRNPEQKAQRIFSTEIIEEKFPNLKKEVSSKVQDICRDTETQRERKHKHASSSCTTVLEVDAYLWTPPLQMFPRARLTC